MKLTTIAVAIAATIAMTSASYATGLGRCQNLPDIVKPDNAPVDHQGKKPGDIQSGGYAGIPGTPGCPIKSAAGTCPTGSLSDPELGGAYFTYQTFDGFVADILVHQTGEVDIKDSLKATLEATKNAPQNQGKPVWKWEVVKVEVVDWDEPTQGSHC